MYCLWASLTVQVGAQHDRSSQMATTKRDYELSGDIVSVLTLDREPVSRIFFEGDYPAECVELCAANEACAAIVTYRPFFSAAMCRFYSADAELVPRTGYTSYLLLPVSPPPSALALVLSGQPGSSSPALVLGLVVAIVAVATALIVLACRRRAAAAAKSSVAASAQLWQSSVDPESGETYWWHTQTGEASWDAPPGWDPPPAEEVAAIGPTAAAASTEAAAAAEAAAAKAAGAARAARGAARAAEASAAATRGAAGASGLAPPPTLHRWHGSQPARCY